MFMENKFTVNQLCIQKSYCILNTQYRILSILFITVLQCIFWSRLNVWADAHRDAVGKMADYRPTVCTLRKCLLNCKSGWEQIEKPMLLSYQFSPYATPPYTHTRTHSLPLPSVLGHLGIIAHWSAMAKPARFIDSANDEVQSGRSATSAITASEGHNKV